MLLALEDPVWARLYGPSGIRNVSQIIARLGNDWDDALAKELYWDRLQHQDTLYPVTYAALPHLWNMSAALDHCEIETLYFFSHVVDCGLSGPKGALYGLDTDIKAHHHPWIPEDKRLRPEDAEILSGLDAWFRDQAPALARVSSDAIPQAQDYADVHLLRGYSAVCGHPGVGRTMEMWSEAFPQEEIRDELPPEDPEGERRTAQRVLGLLGDRNPRIAAFLAEYYDLDASSSS